MKPYTVIVQVRRLGSLQVEGGTEARFSNSRPVPVYAYDETDAVIRATRLLEMDLIECGCTMSVVEGWDKDQMPCDEAQ